MRLEWKNPAVYPKAADPVRGAEMQRGHQCVGILQAEAAQLRQGVMPLHLADGRGRRGDKLDRLIPEQAAEAEAHCSSSSPFNWTAGRHRTRVRVFLVA